MSELLFCTIIEKYPEIVGTIAAAIVNADISAILPSIVGLPFHAIDVLLEDPLIQQKLSSIETVNAFIDISNAANPQLENITFRFFECLISSTKEHRGDLYTAVVKLCRGDLLYHYMRTVSGIPVNAILELTDNIMVTIFFETYRNKESILSYFYQNIMINDNLIRDKYVPVFKAMCCSINHSQFIEMTLRDCLLEGKVNNMPLGVPLRYDQTVLMKAVELGELGLANYLLSVNAETFNDAYHIFDFATEETKKTLFDQMYASRK